MTMSTVWERDREGERPPQFRSDLILYTRACAELYM